MSRLGYFLGGAAIGAAGLGIASYLIDRYGKTQSPETPCIGCDDGTAQEAQSECVSENPGTLAEEAV